MSTKLFLLYNDENISDYSHPDIIPLKLNQTPYFESEAFRMLEDLPNAENIGFLTPSAKRKIKDFSIEKILKLNPDPIFYFCKGRERVEKQAIEYHGKTFLILWRYILDFHRISYSIMNTYYGSYCNLWVAKREFVREYMAMSLFSFSVRPLAKSKAIASGSLTAFSRITRTVAFGSASKIWRTALEPAAAAMRGTPPPAPAEALEPMFAPMMRRPSSVTASAP